MTVWVRLKAFCLQQWQGLSVMVMAFVYVCLVLFSEKLLVENGLGWDGANYAKWAKDFHRLVFETKSLDAFYIHRILPAGLVHYALTWLHIPINTTTIINAFHLMNGAAVVLSLWVWHRIAKCLQWDTSRHILGTIALFVSFPVLKQFVFYSVLTDTVAFLMGMLSLWFYLSNRQWALWFCMVLAAFTWPMLYYVDLFLLLFPRQPLQAEPSKWSWPSILSLSVIMGVIGLITIYMLFFNQLPRDSSKYFWRSTIMWPWVWVSIVGVWLYLWYALAPLFKWHSSEWLNTVKAVFRLQTVRVLLGVAFVMGFCHLFQKPGLPSGTMKNFLANMSMYAVHKPLVFLVGHLLYFGPILFLTLFLWPHLVRHIRQQGAGMVMAWVFTLVMALDSESRHFVHFIPFVVVCTLQVLGPSPIPRLQIVYWFVLCFAYSKLWLPVNGVTPYDVQHLPLFFMNWAPWLSSTLYWTWLCIHMIVGLLLYRFGFPFVRAEKTGLKVEPSPDHTTQIDNREHFC